ncbi:mycothiol system anti-sigma-R factor [Luteococcus sp. OSA5]|uniref:mycothiol system anti-sigma-R factor n=1 Tax=Luteococcus sp. OSA5 TaxID=3401630 RepID=UPI003B42AA2E
MTDSLDHAQDPEDACTRALGQVQAFLHGELDEHDSDLIRLHLDACEKCLENFDIEQAISALVRRCCPPTTASSELRMRIVKMSITMHEQQ